MTVPSSLTRRAEAEVNCPLGLALDLTLKYDSDPANTFPNPSVLLMDQSPPLPLSTEQQDELTKLDILKTTLLTLTTRIHPTPAPPLRAPRLKMVQPNVADRLTAQEKLLLAQAVYKLGASAKAWPGVAAQLKAHPCVADRPPDLFVPAACEAAYNSLMAGLDITMWVG